MNRKRDRFKQSQSDTRSQSSTRETQGFARRTPNQTTPVTNYRSTKRNGLKVPTLSDERRSEIIRTMTAQQLMILEKYTMLKARSKFHTERYLNNTDWEFYGLRIDYSYRDPKWSHRNRRQMLYCDCNRQLKFQYELRSRTTGRKLFLGIKHFCDHLGIPQSVANEIKKGVNEINIYTDAILIAFQRGERFPKNFYLRACELEIEEITTGKAAERYADHYRANLPLFNYDSNRLKRLVNLRELELSEECRRLKLEREHQQQQSEQKEPVADTVVETPEAETLEERSNSSKSVMSQRKNKFQGYLQVVEPSLEEHLPEKMYQALVKLQTDADKKLIWIIGSPAFKRYRVGFIKTVITPFNRLVYENDADAYFSLVSTGIDRVLMKADEQLKIAKNLISKEREQESIQTQLDMLVKENQRAIIREKHRKRVVSKVKNDKKVIVSKKINEDKEQRVSENQQKKRQTMKLEIKQAQPDEQVPEKIGQAVVTEQKNGFHSNQNESKFLANLNTWFLLKVRLIPQDQYQQKEVSERIQLIKKMFQTLKYRADGDVALYEKLVRSIRFEIGEL